MLPRHIDAFANSQKKKKKERGITNLRFTFLGSLVGSAFQRHNRAGSEGCFGVRNLKVNLVEIDVEIDVEPKLEFQTPICPSNP